MTQPVSILNDVLGPIMRGPSSSHTAGAFRIARLAISLAGERPVRFRCTFDPSGSYAATWRPLGVDLAFAAGILGWEITDPRYHSAVTAASGDGMPVEFDVEPLALADHPNSVRVEMFMSNGSSVELWAKSTGGGTIEITRLGEWSIAIDGRSWEVLVECAPSDVAEITNRALELLGPDVRSIASSSGLVHLSSSTEVCKEAVDHLTRIDGVVSVRHCSPVLRPQPGESRFESVGEMCRWAEGEGLSLGEAAMVREGEALGLSADDLGAEMLRRWAVMRASVDDGLDDERIRMPLTDPTASTLLQREKAGVLPLGGILTRVAARAMAVMHLCNSKGIVCAAPTGGSAGVLPAVLFTLASERGVSEQAIIRGLFAAGGVGAGIAARATFAAEIAGCQVEIGAAGAMAAAAVVEIAGGAADQAAAAAAIALQNTMGSVCDPVGGGCEIPCHTRNAVAAANAYLCADLAVGGASNAIPLDETIDASFEVGKALPAELRCTALGGIAVAPSAKRLVRVRTRF